MSPILIAGPAVEPVALAEAKTFLRVDGEAEDALVASLLAGAREALELATRRAFIAQTWRLHLDWWPQGKAVRLPLAPVLSVVAVRITPASGPAAVLDPGLYRLDVAADPPRLLVGAAAPEPGVTAGGIEIDARYGFGAAAGDVPAPIRLAIQRLAAFWFEQRGDEIGAARGLPGDVQALVAPFIRARLA
jgi:uncharacterized phiE125 gp8 family phage protein